MKPTFSKEIPSSTRSAYRFGEFTLEPSERLLSKSGVIVPLQPKLFDALLLLVSDAGHLVTKADLMRSLWPNTHVSEANLTNIIVTLRKLLGRDSITTLSKYGYRFELPILSEPGIEASTYEAFVRARQIIQNRSLEQMSLAKDLLTLCVAQSPIFAQGWAWLGRSCMFLEKFSASPSINAAIAQTSLERALAIQPNQPDAHAFLTLSQVDAGRATDATDRLLQQLREKPSQPELYAALVQSLRFCGLLGESMDSHLCARELDPAIATSVAQTLFFAGDFAGCVESYAGRTPYYLDAAAWAALGMRERAVQMLDRRLSNLPLSNSIHALLRSLLFLLKAEGEISLSLMEAAIPTSEPEVLVFFARHYSYLGENQSAISILRLARDAGFCCAPETLLNDPWFSSLRESGEFQNMLETFEANVAVSRKRYAKIFEEVGLIAN